MDAPTLPAEPATPATSRAARWLALGTVAGPVLFTLAWLVLGFLSPGYTLFGTLIAPYSPDGAQQGVAGLTQRLLAIEVQAWFVALGWLAFRPTADTDHAPGDRLGPPAGRAGTQQVGRRHA